MVLPGQAALRTGDLLAGKYRLERVLGFGGMGVVVAARHEQLGQLVAIKFVRDETLEQSDAVERFVREARAAVKLRSEHVARVLDVGVLDSGAPYMVMEFLEGSDLGQVLSDDGPLPVETAVLMIIQACEAVAEAHAAGIVHRDLKPQNLFLTRTLGGSPRLKVLDFGVSKAIGLTNDPRALTRTRAMLGSPLYMAPEQMRSARDVDARVDIWALGVVLFELLTRRWPFEGESMPELCLKVVTDPPQSLAALRPDVPPGLVGIVERCLEKAPNDRFSSANDLALALDPYAPPLVGRLGSPRPSRPESANPPPRMSDVSADLGAPRLSIAPDATMASASTESGPSVPEVAATPAAWGSNEPAATPGEAGIVPPSAPPLHGDSEASGTSPRRGVAVWAWLAVATVALVLLLGRLALKAGVHSAKGVVAGSSASPLPAATPRERAPSFEAPPERAPSFEAPLRDVRSEPVELPASAPDTHGSRPAEPAAPGVARAMVRGGGSPSAGRGIETVGPSARTSGAPPSSNRTAPNGAQLAGSSKAGVDEDIPSLR